MRQRHGDRALHETGADVPIDGVEARRGDPHPNLTVTRDGLLDVLVAEDVGVAELVESHCLHRTTSFVVDGVHRKRRRCVFLGLRRLSSCRQCTKRTISSRTALVWGDTGHVVCRSPATKGRLRQPGASARRRHGTGSPATVSECRWPPSRGTPVSASGPSTGTSRPERTSSALGPPVVRHGARQRTSSCRRAGVRARRCPCVPDATLRDRDRFVLPLHGGPVIFNAAIREVQAEIRGVLQTLLDRGRAARQLRGDLDPVDLIVAASLLSRPLPNVDDWDALAHRQIELFLNGLGPPDLSSPADAERRLTGRGIIKRCLPARRLRHRLGEQTP